MSKLYTDFVIDLETTSVDTSKSECIIQIGCAAINRHNLSLAPAVFNVPVSFFVTDGDFGTLKWWNGTNPKYLTKLKTHPKSVALGTALEMLATFITSHSSTDTLKGVWGNGVTFDNEFLNKAYTKLNITKPWTYRHDSCLRTVLNLYPNIKRLKNAAIEQLLISQPHREDWHEHNAEFDALLEASLLSEVFADMKDARSYHGFNSDNT